MGVDKVLIDKLLAEYKSPEEIVGENGLLKQLTKALVERTLQAELTTHLGYEKHTPAENEQGNTGDGTSSSG
jgi:putative transposase